MLDDIGIKYHKKLWLRGGFPLSYLAKTHAGAELDLLIVRGRKRIGFEFKRTSAPRITPSMRSALQNLKLTCLDIVHAGENTFMMDKKIRAVSSTRILKDIEPLS